MKLSLILIFSIAGFFNTTSAQQVFFNNNFISIELNIYGRARIFVQDREFFESITLIAGISNDYVFDFYEDADLQDSISQFIDKYYQLYGGFNNNFSNKPPHIIEKVKILSPPNEPYALFQYNIINDSTEAIALKIGLDLNSKIGGTFGYDSVKFSDTNNVVHIYKNNDHVGFKLLSDSLSALTSFNWNASYYSDSNYWSLLNSSIMDTLFYSDENGPVIILSQPIVNINPGDSVSVFYAFAYGTTDSMMYENISKTERMFLTLTPVKENNNLLPDNFYLSQNYPNPFNPSTKISFTIPSEEFVTLKVYTSLGEEVATLVQERLNPGKYIYNFSSINLSSGIYFYKLSAGRFSSTKKMVLIK